MRAAVALVLALCAALMLRVRPALPEHPHTDQGNSHCEDSPYMRIIYQHDKWNDYDRRYIGWAQGENKVSIPYGSSLDVFCSSPTNAGKLTMKWNGQKLVTEKIYVDASASPTRQDLLTSKDVLVCTNDKSTCTSLMAISVTPAFEVISHNRQIFVDKDHINYTVQYGEAVTVLCSGPEAARLVMSQDGEPLLTQLESNTTIKHFVKQTDLLISEYVCTDNHSTYNSSVTIKVLPAVHLQSQNETITPVSAYEELQFYYWEYKNSDVEVHCFGPRTVKLVSRGEDNIPFTENFIKVNPHRVKYINKLKTGKWYFECSVSEFPDYVTSVEITIIPRMEVMSPNIRRIGSRDDTIHYEIKYGDTIEITCSGSDSDKLLIAYAINNEVGFKNTNMVVTLNTTAIKYTLKEPGMDSKIRFWCSKEGRSRSVVIVSVGVVPADVVDFRCVSDDGRMLSCIWTAPSNKVNFKLSHVENAILPCICHKTPRSFSFQYNDEQAKVKEWVLLLQSCTSVGCFNQTFHIDHLSIVKPAPVEELRVIDIKPRGAVLKWYANSIHVAGERLSDNNNDFHHKVQYWYSGIEPREVNSSLVTCRYGCKIELNLPCPRTFYKVWIYQKLKRTVGEEFWSDPSSITFHTESDEDTTNDTTCSGKPRKKPAVMEYFVQEDKKEVHLEMQALKEKVISLKNKLATIRALIQKRKHTP